MRRFTRGRYRGFTLVETLCAGMLLAVFTTVIGMSVTQSTVAVSSMDDYKTAAQWLDIIMTRIDTYGPERLEREGPRSGQLDERFTWSATIESESIGDLYRVEVKVRWKSARGSHQVKAYTLLNDPIYSRNAMLFWEDL